MIVYKNVEDDWLIFKNPNDLNLIGPSSRGLIDKYGNLFIESYSNKTIHNDILAILYNTGLLEGKFRKNWGGKLPQDSGFLTIQRYKDSNFIAIGESNRLIYDENNWKEKESLYDEFLKLVRKKNPDMTFTTKLVGIKVFGKNNNDEQINLIKNDI